MVQCKVHELTKRANILNGVLADDEVHSAIGSVVHPCRDGRTQHLEAVQLLLRPCRVAGAAVATQAIDSIEVECVEVHGHLGQVVRI